MLTDVYIILGEYALPCGLRYHLGHVALFMSESSVARFELPTRELSARVKAIAFF